MIDQTTETGKAILFLIGGLVFVIFGATIAYLLAPNRPNSLKTTSYECGEQPQGTAWAQFNIRYYVMGLIFLIFDVEILFLIPTTVVMSQDAIILLDNRWGRLIIFEVVIFILILLLGLIYIWKKQDIDWERPNPYLTQVKTGIPLDFYKEL